MDVGVTCRDVVMMRLGFLRGEVTLQDWVDGVSWG